MCEEMSFKLLVLALALAGFPLAGCASEGNPETTAKTSMMRTCGEAQTSAMGAVNEQRYAEALRYYESALQLCSKHVKIEDDVLHGIADIGRLEPGRCSQCVALFHSVSVNDRIDYLRSAAGLDHFCGHGSRGKDLLGSLVNAELAVYSLADLGQLRGVVMEYENVRLTRWTGNKSEFLRHLKLGTKELCSEGIFPAAMQSLERWSTREEHPVGGLLGSWTIQPAVAFDPDIENCLGRAAHAIEARFNRLPQHSQWQVKQWLDWYKTHTQSGSP